MMSDDQMAAHNERVLAQCLRRIDYRVLGAIVFCSARGWFDGRKLQAIQATCEEFCIRPDLVLAAAGWLWDEADGAGRFVQVFEGNHGSIQLPDGDEELAACFRISQLAFGLYPVTQCFIGKPKPTPRSERLPSLEKVVATVRRMREERNEK